MHATRIFTAFVGTFLSAASVGKVLYADTMDETGYRSNSDPARDSTERAEAEERSRKDHFRIGALGGVGFPRPLAIEGLIKVEKRASSSRSRRACRARCPPGTVASERAMSVANSFGTSVVPTIDLLRVGFLL